MKWIFDATLAATFHVPADSEEQARKILMECLDCADANFGAWPNGEPILAEASLYCCTPAQDLMEAKEAIDRDLSMTTAEKGQVQ